MISERWFSSVWMRPTESVGSWSPQSQLEPVEEEVLICVYVMCSFNINFFYLSDLATFEKYNTDLSNLQLIHLTGCVSMCVWPAGSAPPERHRGSTASSAPPVCWETEQRWSLPHGLWQCKNYLLLSCSEMCFLSDDADVYFSSLRDKRLQ